MSCEKCERFALWHAKQIAPLIDRIATLEREADRLRERCGTLGALFVTTPGEPTRLTAPPTAAYERKRDVSGDDELGIEYTKQREENT